MSNYRIELLNYSLLIKNNATNKKKDTSRSRIKCINQKTNYSENAKILCLSYFNA